MYAALDPYAQDTDPLLDPCFGTIESFFKTGTGDSLRYDPQNTDSAQAWGLFGGNVPSSFPNPTHDFVVTTTGPQGSGLLTVGLEQIGSQPYQEFNIKISGSADFFDAVNGNSLASNPELIGPNAQDMGNNVTSRSSEKWFLVGAYIQKIGDVFQDGLFYFQEFSLNVAVSWDSGAKSTFHTVQIFYRIATTPGTVDISRVDLGRNTNAIAAIGLGSGVGNQADFDSVTLAWRRNQSSYAIPASCFL